MKQRITAMPVLAAMIIAVVAGCSEQPGGSGGSGDSTNVAVTGVQINNRPAAINIGEVVTLVATVLPEDATNRNVTWESSHPEIARVTRGTGTVTGVAEGSATITVRTLDGDFEDQCVISVGAVRLIGVSLADKLYVAKGFSLPIEPVFEPANATDKTLTWESDDETVATVEWNAADSGWYVKGIADGSTRITLTSRDGDHTASCAIEVDWLGRTQFVTEATWLVGRQTWSDAVIAAGCMKDTYDGGYYNANDPNDYAYYSDCRSNNPREYGDLFSWQAVSEFKDRLCPDGWRVPGRQDFVDLDMALGGNGAQRYGDMAVVGRYMAPDIWGGRYNGVADEITGGLYNQDLAGSFWTQDETYQNGYRLVFSYEGNVSPQSRAGKSWGLGVRCVK